MLTTLEQAYMAGEAVSPVLLGFTRAGMIGPVWPEYAVPTFSAVFMGGVYALPYYSREDKIVSFWLALCNEPLTADDADEITCDKFNISQSDLEYILLSDLVDSMMD